MFWVDSVVAFVVFPFIGFIFNPVRVGVEYIYTWPIWWFNVRFYKISQSDLYQQGKPMYLCNHRTWSDFFIDRVLTNLRGAYLSRWLVLAGFPLAASLCYLGDTLKFFYRGTDRKANQKRLYKLLDSYSDGIIVYPEGKRNTSEHTLELKTGCIRYAWDRKRPIQVILSRGKELVLNEFSQTSRMSRDVFVYYGTPLFPDEYDSFDTLLRDVQVSWDHGWNTCKDSTPKAQPMKIFIPDDVKLTPWRYMALYILHGALMVTLLKIWIG